MKGLRPRRFAAPTAAPLLINSRAISALCGGSDVQRRVPGVDVVLHFRPGSTRRHSRESLSRSAGSRPLSQAFHRSAEGQLLEPGAGHGLEVVPTTCPPPGSAARSGHSIAPRQGHVGGENNTTTLWREVQCPPVFRGRGRRWSPRSPSSKTRPARAPPVAVAPGLYANARAQAWRLGGSSSSVLRRRALRQRVGVPVVTRRS